MKKELLLILLVLPLFAVNAQTFQRRAQQPSFFMPKSVMTEPQPERLPAVDSMNYQGRRLTDDASSPFIDSENTADNAEDEFEKVSEVSAERPTPVVPAQQQYAAPEPQAVKPVIKEQQKQIVAQKEKTEKKFVPVDTEPKPDTASEQRNSNDYREVFARILASHVKDLNLISQGQAVNNPEIEQMIKDFVPQVHKLNDTIDVRTVKL